MSPFQNLSSPPPAYINNTLNDNTGTAVLLEPVAQQQRLCSSINPRSTHMHPDEHSILTSSTVGNQNLVDIESRVSAAGSSCAVAAFTEFKQDKLVSKLEEVLRALEKKDEKSSPEDKLISRLENAIRHIGDASISEGKRDIRKPIKFKDAVGRRFSFPYHRCETWAGIEELIKQAFLHVEIIGPHVQEGHYDLMNPAGEVILPQVWEDHVEPGWSISMSMWPMPNPIPRPPPPPVHVIVDRGPPSTLPSFYPGPPMNTYPPGCRRKHSSDVDLFTSEKKGIRGLWSKIAGIFKKNRSKDYDSDSNSSLACD